MLNREHPGDAGSTKGGAGSRHLRRAFAPGSVQGGDMNHEKGLLRSHAVLSGRELEVLKLLSADRSAGEIGAALDISPQTVQRHLHEIYLKLGLAGRKGRLAAARWYWEH